MSDALSLSDLVVNHPIFFFYAAALVLLGLICTGLICTLLTMRSEWRGLHVIPWAISWMDFARYFWFNVLWYLTSMMIVILIGQAFPALSTEAGGILGSFLFPLGTITIFLVFLLARSQPYSSPVNSQQRSLPLNLVSGLILFLGAYPIIALIGLLWQTILIALKNRGWDVPMETQDIVTLFGEETNPVMFGAMLVLAVVMAPIAEELLFRAGIYRFLKGRFSVWVAMLASSALFGLLHMNLLGFPSLMAVGICLCLAYELTGNIRVSIIFHALFNLNSIILITLMPDELQMGLLHFKPWF